MKQALPCDLATLGIVKSNNLSIYLYLFFQQFNDKRWPIVINAKMLKDVLDG